VVVAKSMATAGNWHQLDQLGKQGYLIAHSNIAPAAIGPAGPALVQRPAASVTAAPVAAVADQPHNVQIFFGIYFLMTGLHSIHVIVGIILLTYLLVRAIRKDFGPGYYAPVDFIGLYWGVVDMIWMFLFPLLYLIR
jgi:cytochrome c oxidase subunit 3